MCCDTKQKIAQALRQLMLERPLKKITVQDLMESTKMKRQTFYYHFQDIYDVLVWICRRQLVEPLERPDYASFEEWLTTALELLDRDRQFYRRAMAAADPSPLNALCEELLRPRLRALLFGCREERLDENQRFVLDFAMHAVMDQLRRMLLSRRPLDLSDARAKAVCLLETFGLDEAERNNAVHIADASAARRKPVFSPCDPYAPNAAPRHWGRFLFGQGGKCPCAIRKTLCSFYTKPALCKKVL